MFSRLHAMLGQLDGTVPTSTELAEIVWLAQYLQPDDREPSPEQGPETGPPMMRTSQPTSEATVPRTEASAGEEARDAGESLAPSSPAGGRTGVHSAAPAGQRPTTGGSYMPVLVPTAEALGERLALQRAIRPLKRRVPSHRSFTVDEEATATAIADAMTLGARPRRRTARTWPPVLRPTEERWLELAVVVDQSPSMALWRPYATHLYDLMNEAGVFSDVRLWRLHSVGGKCLVSPAGSPDDLRSPSTVSSSSSRRAILLVSDCTDLAWWGGEAVRVVKEWATTNPVGIVQPLPERLWCRTAAPAVPGRIVSPRPGSPNSSLNFVPFEDFSDVSVDRPIVPVMQLSAPWLHGWASMVSGLAGPELPTAAASFRYLSAGRAVDTAGFAMSASERVLAFRSAASPEAFRLAGYLAVTALTLPVMRLVQRAFLRGVAEPAHLAEVVLGGLMRATSPGGDSYEFFEGVHELLLKTLPRSEVLSAVQVLERISAQIESRAGSSQNAFRALLPSRDHFTGGLSAAGPQFALVSPETVARLAPPARPDPKPVDWPEDRKPAAASRSGVPPPIRVAPATSGPQLRVRRPMMFVGLGGTGCKVGTELEKRLRMQLCGPDGTWLLGELGGRGYLPFQLPSCLQFVYADLSADELQQTRRDVVLGVAHDTAAQRTRYLTSDLVPAGLTSSLDVERSLRVHVDEEIIRWLPKGNGLRVGPLANGAGQLPAVGRAALFETMRRNPNTAQRGIRKALAGIFNSGADLFTLSGKQTRSPSPIAVFVVFSVAGGTGGGIFYDYLHLIGDLIHKSGAQAQIYPMVLMPSAFDDLGSGERSRQLNAGSALVDLFRLIDDQNAPGSPHVLDAEGAHGPISVRYPQQEPMRLPPDLMQRALLFGRPSGVRRDDVHRSMVSLMVSLIGNEPADEDWAKRSNHLFVDGFLATPVLRHTPDETGVGRRGATTITVSELTAPFAQLINVVTSRLLARAIDKLVPPSAAETSKPDIRRFITASGLEPVLNAAPDRVPPLGNPVGYSAVLRALTDRARAMSAAVERMAESLPGRVASLARRFDPAAAATVLLRDLDPFRLWRVIFGHDDLPDPLDQGGCRSLLESWQWLPEPPPGLNAAAPPQLQAIPRRYVQRLRIVDEPVQKVIQEQETWYAWQARRHWHVAWHDSQQLWSRPWHAFVKNFQAICDEFLMFARNEPQSFDAWSRDLYEPRAGVTYLLPSEDRGLEGFYQVVLARLRQHYGQHLGPNAHEGDILNLLLGRAGWADAYAQGRGHPEAAVVHVRQLISAVLTELIRPSDRSRPALVPRIEDLLASAALRHDYTVSDDELVRFQQKLAELVPGGFAPDGHTPIWGLITYPAAQRNDDIERFLHQVSLPRDLDEPEFRAVQAESIVVVLTRSSMGITGVPEARRAIKLWTDAHQNPKRDDNLAWRRRLSQDTAHLLMDERDRQHVLHRLLCAAWAGQVTVAGDPSSPAYLNVEVDSLGAMSMKLELIPQGMLSSWASVLQAYERWILTDDPTRRGLAARFLRAHPARAGRPPAPPAREFTLIVDLADGELAKLERREHHQGDGSQAQQFWSVTLPAALHRHIDGTSKSLLDLREQVGNADGASH